MTGTKVEKVDAENNFVQLQDGRKIEYGKCLIATGENTFLSIFIIIFR